MDNSETGADITDLEDRPEINEDLDIEDSNPQSEGGADVKSGFPQVTKLFMDTPHKAFEDPAYYKSLMSESGGESAKRLHSIFQKYATAKDPKDKTVFR
ncbi:MAG: hypothetical protein LBV52_02940, partial [Spirochaetaceae bacterium]|nr:hypothetical protein [Spirochaetaceae bacterium]